MYKLIINLSVGILTFVIGSLASTLFYGGSPSNENARSQTIFIAQSETLSTGKSCHRDSMTGGTELSAPIAEKEIRIHSTPLVVKDELPAPVQFRAPISHGVLNGLAKSLPPPTYPAIAKAANASGTVVVQVTIDESGNVESARAVSGHPLLQSAAVEAAYRARFTPTQLSGQPVKVTGVITYNFVSQ